MRVWLVAALLIPAFAGCLGDNESPVNSFAPMDATNPWQQGLATWYPTPPHAEVRDAGARTADVAPPGSADWVAFDALMESFMEVHDTTAGSLAVMQDGNLLYTSGYGDADETALFRLASVTKPMTRALITLQVEEGLYDWDDPVFCIPPEPAPDCRLPIAPHDAHPIVDDRLANVTVEMLVTHTGGWGRSTDWLYRGPQDGHPGTIGMAAALGVDLPLPAWRAAQYLMGEPLADDPGSQLWYCNSCYMLAGLVAEAATGANLQALYDAYLFRPLGVEGDIELGRALPEDRNPREPDYACTGTRSSAYEPDKEVCGADGGFSMELVSSGGGLIATAAAVAAVYEAYPELVPHADFNVNQYGLNEPVMERRAHGGLLDGTSTKSGIVVDRAGAAGTLQYVYLFNHHRPATRCPEIPTVVFDDIRMGCMTNYFEQAIIHAALARGAAPL